MSRTARCNVKVAGRSPRCNSWQYLNVQGKGNARLRSGIPRSWAGRPWHSVDGQVRKREWHHHSTVGRATDANINRIEHSSMHLVFSVTVALLERASGMMCSPAAVSSLVNLLLAAPMREYHSSHLQPASIWKPSFRQILAASLYNIGLSTYHAAVHARACLGYHND